LFDRPHVFGQRRGAQYVLDSTFTRGSLGMGYRRLIRDRAPAAAAACGLLIILTYVGVSVTGGDRAGLTRAQRLLVEQPWYCEVYDPNGQLVSSSIETFHPGGTLDGLTRLEDRVAGRVLLEFSYRGQWQFDDPWLTEAIEEYRYLHVDDAAFSEEELVAIEAEFAEPEVSRVHALTQGQLVYGAHQSLYQCHRRTAADVDRFQTAASSATGPAAEPPDEVTVTPAQASRASTASR
jgi:hypothetical protein